MRWKHGTRTTSTRSSPSFTPDVEWHPSLEPAFEGKATTFKGHDGARRAWAEYRGEMFERLTIQVEEIRDLGESVLLLGRFTVTGRATHIEFDTEVGQLYTFRDGKIARAAAAGRSAG